MKKILPVVLTMLVFSSVCFAKTPDPVIGKPLPKISSSGTVAISFGNGGFYGGPHHGTSGAFILSYGNRGHFGSCPPPPPHHGPNRCHKPCNYCDRFMPFHPPIGRGHVFHP